MQRFPIRFATFLTLLFLLVLPVSAARLLIPGGQVIGIHLYDGTVSVAAIDETLGSASKKAGLAAGDRIVAIDGKQVRKSEDVRAALRQSDGTVDVSILRCGQSKKLHICPTATADGPKLGVYLKEGTTGIGTVTYQEPGSGSFGALGHGVNDPEGNCLRMESGRIYSAAVASVKKGTAGTPGQLMGSIAAPEALGTLSKNLRCGIYGTGTLDKTAAPLPAATKEEIKTGPATIRSTVSGTDTREYSVEIVKIYASGQQTGRNMLIRVTDPALLEATGGIVQGMSGSPIIQDGKLVGAVTHVLVNDPTMGYGIFIENMLDAAA